MNERWDREFVAFLLKTRAMTERAVPSRVVVSQSQSYERGETSQRNQTKKSF